MAPFKRKSLATIFVILIIALSVYKAAEYFGWGKTSPPVKTRDTVSVISTLVTAEDFATYLSGIGSVTPLFAVTVKARVDGQLQSVNFREGQSVAAGDILAQIDPAPYKAQLDLARAQKARDLTTLANANTDLERYKQLWKQDAVSQQILATQQTTVDQLKATVQADQAQIDIVQVQLDYTTLRSPIKGRTGMRGVDPGNIVRATDSNGIVNINQIDPISVLFTLPEDKFQAINRAIESKKGKPLVVQAFARENNELLATGKLMLINNQIDTATGTIQLKAEFTNATHKLWPGQYVNVRLGLGTLQKVTIVPESVIQRGPNNLYAYVIDDNNTVHMQPIKLGVIQEGKAIIESGLTLGDRVVVEGQYKLKPGLKVVEQQAVRSNGKNSPPAKAP